MSNQYKLKTNDSLKCSACGNDTFEEMKISKDGMECYVYVCTKCGHLMGFKDELKKGGSR